MSLTNLTTKTPYAGNGVTTVFPFTFKVFQAADLVVTETTAAGVTTTLVLNTDYTVTGAGLDANGSITRLGATSPPPTGTTGLIRRVVALTQTADIRNQSAFYAAIHEDVFDKLTMVDQQQEEEIGRSLQIPEQFSTGVSNQLPAPVASTAIGWNAAGTGLANLVIPGVTPGYVASFNARIGDVVPTLNDYSFSLISGVASVAQIPALPASQITSGQLASAQMPALTGDVTSSAGSTATTLAAAQSGAHTWSAVQTFSNGSAGAPSQNFGDPTTGWYRSALNAISAAVGGVQTVTVSSKRIDVYAGTSQVVFRIAGGVNELCQVGPNNSNTTSMQIGAGATNSSLGSYIDSLSTGALNFYGLSGALRGGFDASGNFTASVSLNGPGTGLTGTAASLTAGNATKLATARTIQGVSFDGSANITLPVFVASGASHAVGLVPDPGASAGTTRFLREDATWGTPVAASNAINRIINGSFYQGLAPWGTSGTTAPIFNANSATANSGSASGVATVATATSLTTTGSIYQGFSCTTPSGTLTLTFKTAIYYTASPGNAATGYVKAYLYNLTAGTETLIGTYNLTASGTTPTFTGQSITVTSNITAAGDYGIRFEIQAVMDNTGGIASSRSCIVLVDEVNLVI